MSWISWSLVDYVIDGIGYRTTGGLTYQLAALPCWSRQEPLKSAGGVSTRRCSERRNHGGGPSSESGLMCPGVLDIRGGWGYNDDNWWYIWNFGESGIHWDFQWEQSRYHGFYTICGSCVQWFQVVTLCFNHIRGMIGCDDIEHFFGTCQKAVPPENDWNLKT